MGLPWDGRLIKLGFFRELDHGESDGLSLEDCRVETPDPDQERIARYLESGHLYTAASKSVMDVLAAESNVVIGPPHVLTDGAYAWPADLLHYVRNYHVRLPRHFVIHIRRNDFQVPANVEVASLKLE